MGIMERREREKLKRRSDIIDAAEKIFFRKGVGGATMDEVADEAELSKGTLYLYFKSKEELHFAINMRAADLMYDAFKKAIEPGKSGFENCVNIGRAYMAFALHHVDYFKSIMYFQHKPTDQYLENDAFYKKHIEEKNTMQLFVDVVVGGMKDGTISSEMDPGVLCQNLWAMSSGVLLHLVSQKISMHGTKTGNKIDEEQFMKGFFQIIKNGIAI